MPVSITYRQSKISVPSLACAMSASASRSNVRRFLRERCQSTTERQQNQALLAPSAIGVSGARKSVPTQYPPRSGKGSGYALANALTPDQVAAAQDANDRGQIAAA